VATQWIDLVDPTRDEILHSVATALDPDAVEILATPQVAGRVVRPSLEAHGGYALVVLAYPRLDPMSGVVEYLELDLVVTPRVLLSVRKSGPRGALAPTDAIAARAEAGAPPGVLTHAATDDATDTLLDLLDDLYGQIDELDGDIENLSGPDVRRRVAGLRHELLVARRTASATRGIARRIADGRVDVGESALFPHDVEALFVDSYDTLVRVTEELDVARDLLAGVREYYQAKVAEQQNDVAKKLTVIASLVLVPSFIVGFYGQNFASDFDKGFWSVDVSVWLIVATTVAQLVLFRWRRWI
jgi:magnesium transporter